MGQVNVDDVDAAVRVLEKLWLRALWGGQVNG